MFATKGESCAGIMIEFDRRPFYRGMTSLAFIAIAPLMLVIIAMAGETIRSHLLSIKRARVTRVACDLSVFADESKRRFAFMIEAGIAPFVDAMASLAPLAVSPPMNILKLMTGSTGGGCGLVALPGVAGSAGDIAMRPKERKIRAAMVELRLPPRRLGVTIGASLPQLTLMRIVLFMTGSARPRRFMVWGFGHMAIGTSGAAVDTAQREVGKIMIECIRVEANDIGIPAFMVGMTMLAIGLGHLSPAAMETCPGLDIRRDIFMAGDT